MNKDKMFEVLCFIVMLAIIGTFASRIYNHEIEESKKYDKVMTFSENIYKKNHDVLIYYDDEKLIVKKDDKYDIYEAYEDWFIMLTELEFKKYYRSEFRILGVSDIRSYLIKNRNMYRFVNNHDVYKHRPFSYIKTYDDFEHKQNISLFINQMIKDDASSEIFIGGNHIFRVRDKGLNEDVSNYDSDDSDKTVVGDKIYEVYEVYETSKDEYDTYKMVKLDLLKLLGEKDVSTFLETFVIENADKISIHPSKKSVEK